MPNTRRGRSPRDRTTPRGKLPDLIPVSYSGLWRVKPPPRRRADRLAGSHLSLGRLLYNTRFSLWGQTTGLKVVITPSSDNDLGWGAMCLGHIVVCNFRVRRWLGPAVYLVDIGITNMVMRLDKPPAPYERIEALVIDIYRHDMAYRDQAHDLLQEHLKNRSAKEASHVD